MRLPLTFQSGSENYQQYNQLSPNRSPSGPTYTQLSGGSARPAPGVNVNAPGNTYHPSSSAQGANNQQFVLAEYFLKTFLLSPMN